MSFDVRGQVALITGANRGIGRALVEGFVNAGVAKLYAAVRSLDSVQPLVDQFGITVVPLQLDLTKDESVRTAAGQADDVNIVVNNAGVLRTTPVLSADACSSLQFEMDTNVYGLLRIAQAFAPILKRNGGGALVQLNSVVSMKCFPDFSTYCASKAAAYSLTQALRAELASQSTQVFSVHPGPIATDMGHAAGLDAIADPPACVADALLAALRTGDFHVFPDKMAKHVGAAYDSFARLVIDG